MSESVATIATAYLDALRLAREGASDYESFARMADTLLAEAPRGPGKGDTLSVQYLLDAMREGDVYLTVGVSNQESKP